MCILFMYNGSNDEDSDYSLIVASNRDEIYLRPSKTMGPWSEDPNVIGGRDLEAAGGGTWLAFSPLRRKLGVILNLPRTRKPDAQTRGKIVADYVKSDSSVEEYIGFMKSYMKDCNEFIFIAAELGSGMSPSIHSYSNDSNTFLTHTDKCLAFGNSLPDTPLKKVVAGRSEMQKICSRLNKVQEKEKLVEELTALLKSEERHLPDPELEKRRPTLAQHLSSIYVTLPGYGTRTHTLILITKAGHAELIEIALKPQEENLTNWQKSVLHFDVKSQL